MKIGLYGGSFDPVHLGHLIVAQAVYERFGLGRLIFIPAAQAPLKAAPVRASGPDRLAMLEAAIAGDTRFTASDIELRRGGTSYTIDTVAALRTQYPQAALYWIIGADQAAQLPHWHQVEVLAQQVEFIAVGRPSAHGGALIASTALAQQAASPPQIPGLRLHWYDGPLIDISSTQLRDRAQRGLPLDYLMPHKALVYLKAQCLYREATTHEN